MTEVKENKIQLLLIGLLLDGIGMLSFAIPGIGEFSDVIWAPVAGWLMTRMYKGKIGQAAGLVTFVEELVPGLDVIPSFTIMWFYTYVIAKRKK
ncbi:hypothetical protein M3P19_05715 [Muricauda sp. 2012CJ35-5]|uniref:DUF4126 domain-containing protein n=1 Tax=Flagellimonas spongiicola TaxID=2942208 RepID=A0ABT0PQ31_9FLAO|nr:hypothetical protein [Allomuricauda spongiicola]MCL6273497.1 hypothetical protein [Allomuricauda spongiicola]